MSEIQSEKKQEIIEKQENEQQVEQVKQVVAEVIKSEFSGPIPPPSIIKGYEEIVPGAAERIIAMAEKQSEHRQAMERKMIDSESRDGLLGVLFAFLLGVGCLGAAVTLVVVVPQNSGAISGAMLGVTGIASIIATFIKSTRGNFRHNQEVKEKTPEN